MSPRTAVAAAALLLLAGVAAGAFAAHALRSSLAPELLGIFHTAVQYQLVHALGVLATGVLWMQWPQSAGALRACVWLLLAGIVLFCGSLYALALTGVRGFGVIAPLGGAAWLMAWALLAWIAWRRDR